MTTSEIRALFDPQGAVVVKFACHVSEHQARELLDAMAETLGAQHTGGKVIYVEKDEQSLHGALQSVSSSGASGVQD